MLKVGDTVVLDSKLYSASVDGQNLNQPVWFYPGTICFVKKWDGAEKCWALETFRDSKKYRIYGSTLTTPALSTKFHLITIPEILQARLNA